MKDIEKESIKEGQVDFITFKELVEDLTGTPFEDIYKDYLKHGANYYDKQSYME